MNHNKFLYSLLLISVTANAQRIELTNGDSLDVELIKQTDLDITFSHPSLGEQTIEKVNISNLQALDFEGIETEENTVSGGLFGTDLFRGWSRNITVGMSGASGASNNLKFRGGFDMLYEDEDDRWDFKSYYLYNSEDDEATDNKMNAKLVKDWFFKDTDWFAFAGVTYDWDEFKNWDHRIQFAAGPGYQFIKNDNFELAGRVGAVAIFEFDKKSQNPNNSAEFDPDIPDTYIQENTQNLEALIGVDVVWHISKMQLFEFSNYIYPNITNAGEFRNLTNISWRHDLDIFKGLAIKFGIYNEYDTTETEKNDLKYNVALDFGF